MSQKDVSAVKIFPWCGCSEEFTKLDKPSDSVFLTNLMTDLLVDHDHLVLPRPLSEYMALEDDYIVKTRAHLAKPISDRASIYSYVMELESDPVYQYLLMNYLENAGYMRHSLRLDH